jgi:radical SAM protein with 4Fe4S-binding SPASM domain
MAESEYVVKKSSEGQALWAKGLPALHDLDIELTERCNNACLHCYINRRADDAEAQARELTTAEWQEILRQAADLGVLNLRITGGEPLLREDFIDLYTFARRLGMKVRLFTNARGITPEITDLFIHIPPLEKIEITVYGLHPESYDAAACAPGGYAEFRRGVELLLERGVPFIVKGALLPPNRGEMDALEAWAASLPGMESPLEFSRNFELRSRRDSPARNRLIQALRLSPEETADLLEKRGESYLKEMVQFCGRFIGPAGTVLFGCGAGKSVNVDAYGKLQPCMLLRDPNLAYDLRSIPLREALEKMNNRLPTLQAKDPDYLARCAVCFLHGLCEQCPAKSWSEHGTLDSPVDYFCRVVHAQARRLGLLKDGENAWEVSDWQARLARFTAASEPSSPPVK